MPFFKPAIKKEKKGPDFIFTEDLTAPESFMSNPQNYISGINEKFKMSFSSLGYKISFKGEDSGCLFKASVVKVNQTAFTDKERLELDRFFVKTNAYEPRSGHSM